MSVASKNEYTIETIEGISFKVIMKVGDDFNDNATKSMTNAEKVEVLNQQTSSLFGNLDTNIKGKYFNPNDKKWETLSYSESYIMMGGNASYGNFLTNIKGFYSSIEEERFELLKSLVKDFTWSGPKKIK